MGWYLSMGIDHEEIEFISISYGNVLEAEMLQEVFPSHFWPQESSMTSSSSDEGGEFDFIASEAKAKAAFLAYESKVKKSASSDLANSRLGHSILELLQCRT
ncbi:MAG: hypothetical protein HY247_06415 [archaeon]|nr:MAG: hypothetical protein HY247_06415 [archaeon]